MLGRRHQPWGENTRGGQKGVLALLTPESPACPCPPAPSFPWGACSRGDTWKGSGARRGGWRAERRQWGAGPGEQSTDQGVSCLRVSAAGHGDGFLFPARRPVLPEALLLFEERVKSSKGAGFLVGFFFVFFYCFDTLMIIFSLIFPSHLLLCG